MKLIHVPVLLKEAVKNLNLRAGSVVVDATFGRGGHASQILTEIGESGKLIGIDRDPVVVAAAKKEFTQPNLIIEESRFSRLGELLDKHEIDQVDGIMFDLGMSSVQLDDEWRGFSFRNKQAKLDLRMGLSEMTAADVLNEYDEIDLNRMFSQWADLKSRRLVKEIINTRKVNKFSEAGDLLAVVQKVFLSGERSVNARVWQALRMEVNSEMQELEEALDMAVKRLKSGGRLVVVSFHSIEDRIVKNFFRKMSASCRCPSELPQCVCQTKPELKIVNKKVIKPKTAEISQNIRSKSARMRVAEKI